jgi:hypothetical protein
MLRVELEERRLENFGLTRTHRKVSECVRVQVKMAVCWIQWTQARCMRNAVQPCTTRDSFSAAKSCSLVPPFWIEALLL